MVSGFIAEHREGQVSLVRGQADARPSPAAVTPPPRKKSLRLCGVFLSFVSGLKPHPDRDRDRYRDRNRIRQKQSRAFTLIIATTGWSQ